MSTKFNFTIEEVNVPSRRLMPQAVIKSDNFMGLLEQTCAFVEEHDHNFLDSCVVIIHEPRKDKPPFVPFRYLASKMTEHMFSCMQMGTKDIEDFTI